MENILIIGGSGFIGSNLADKFSELNYNVKIFDIRKSRYIKKRQKFFKGNILDKKSLSKCIKRNDIVFNFAGLSDLNDAKNKPSETAKLNILGTLNILQICKIKKVKKFIYASSIYANTEEGGFYAVSKRSAEDYIERFCKKYKIRFSILRFGSLYGPRADKGNGLRTIILDGLKKNKLIYYGNRFTQRKYIHIADAVKICSNIFLKKYDNKFLNITGNKTTKITDLFRILRKELKINTSVKYLNMRDSGHYSKSPTIVTPRIAKDLKLKKPINFKYSIKELIKDLKKI